MNNKGYLEISFTWLFALIVGGVILFIAIYASTRVIETETASHGAQIGKDLSTLFSPLETSFESGKTIGLTIPIQTRLSFECNTLDEFGQQIIQTQQLISKKWSEKSAKIYMRNRYLFTDGDLEGKSFYLFSKPFNMPFKVSDLIFMTEATKKYCFLDAPEEIASELGSLAQKNIFVGNCSNIENITRICFAGSCDIKVDINSGTVSKDGDYLYFTEDALMFAAIFSDKNTYECQLKRLMLRLSSLADLYQGKSNLIAQKGCSSNVNIQSLKAFADSFSSSTAINSLKIVAGRVDVENSYNRECALW